MTTVKESVFRLLGNLPDDVSLEEIQYHLYLLRQANKAPASEPDSSTSTAFEIYEKLDLGLGGHSLADSTEGSSGVRRAIRERAKR
jgi:hypothetical protein